MEEEAIQPSAIQRDSMVHEAVSHAVSTLMPGLDTMTTMNDSSELMPSKELPALQQHLSYQIDGLGAKLLLLTYFIQHLQ